MCLARAGRITNIRPICVVGCKYIQTPIKLIKNRFDDGSPRGSDDVALHVDVSSVRVSHTFLKSMKKPNFLDECHENSRQLVQIVSDFLNIS